MKSKNIFTINAGIVLLAHIAATVWLFSAELGRDGIGWIPAMVIAFYAIFYLIIFFREEYFSKKTYILHFIANYLSIALMFATLVSSRGSGIAYGYFYIFFILPLWVILTLTSIISLIVGFLMRSKTAAVNEVSPVSMGGPMMSVEEKKKMPKALLVLAVYIFILPFMSFSGLGFFSLPFRDRTSLMILSIFCFIGGVQVLRGKKIGRYLLSVLLLINLAPQFFYFSYLAGSENPSSLVIYFPLLIFPAIPIAGLIYLWSSKSVREYFSNKWI